MSSVSTKKNRMWAAALVLLFASAAVACGPGPTPTTTTASTSSTSSTSSTTIDPNCGSYTPSGVGLSTFTASPGDSITVSGNGTYPSTIVIKLRKVSDNTVVDPGVTTAVSNSGTWNTGLTLPLSLTTGQWNVVATAQGCTAEATAFINIV